MISSSEVTDIIVGETLGSTTSTRENQGRIFVRKDQQQDQPHRRRMNGGQIIYVGTEDQEDLHRQRSGAEVFYIHRFQVVAFLVISISPHCNVGLFQSGVGSVWMCLNTGSSVLVDCKFGSEAVDEGDSEGRPQRISRKINHIIVRGSAAESRTSSSEEQRAINHLDRRGPRKELRPQGSAAGSTTSS